MPYMNRMHEANRRLWNDRADIWEERSNREDRWHRCHKDPDLASKVALFN